MNHCITLLTAILLTLLPGVAIAAIPSTVQIAGYLYSPGGPAPDGDYYMGFNVLDGPKGAIVWSESGIKVAVKNGHFGHGLGSIKALGAGSIGADRWLEIQIGAEPALPPVPIRSVMAALRAGIAEGLDCSGCIEAAHIDVKALQPYAKFADLGGFAKTGDLQVFAKSADLAEYVKANALAKVAGTGSFKDLTDPPKLSDVALSGAFGDLIGIPALAKVGSACGTGLVVKGIKADGSLDCTAGGVSADTLPKDGLDEISNGLLTTQFTEVAVSANVPLAIPDNLGAGINDTLEVPDFGTVQSLSVSIDIGNSDISKIRVSVFDPSGGVYKLHDLTGTGKVLKATYPTPDKVASGDLTTWIGKNPKGTWSINVTDLAGTPGGKDGAIAGWSIKVGILSSKKATATSAFQLMPQQSAPLPCTLSNMGTLYFDVQSKSIRYCDGGVWRNLADTCGNGILESGEECDDSNNVSGDGCSNICQATYGAAKTKPGVSCLEIQATQKAAKEIAKDGNYWIKAPKGQVIQVGCDMTTETGGYTYFAVDAGKTTFRHTEDNTCKDYGLDIVMPRSIEQWTWMLAKYGNSYFTTIPGVYKTGNGGNYTGCAMRSPASYGSGCSDWRVGDGGRWWLRDSTFGEPNGDYEANCWLSMYNWVAGDIQFNDGTCSYSTAKYLCSTNDKK
ncbi:MAG: DUF4215 domain-containing protein [Myxococcales bacterium]|nr:DUF4215 domain-containing protein [Myxococcales bacterium]